MSGATTYLGGLAATCWLVAHGEPWWGIAVLGVSVVVALALQAQATQAHLAAKATTIAADTMKATLAVLGGKA